MAAPDWDEPGRVYDLRPALPGSYSGLFHRVGIPAFSLLLRGNPEVGELGRTRLERAVGVIYRPEAERQSHYFEARLAEQFDAVVYFDRTNSVTQLR
jgi:erythromycin esterase-like protein